MTGVPSVKVTARLGITVIDGPDQGDDQDGVWCDSGIVRLTPLNPETTITGTSAGPWLAGNHRLDIPIGVDGNITWQGNPWVKVVDFTSDHVNPQVPPNRATHQVEYVDCKAGDVSVEFKAKKVRLAADMVDPATGTCDLVKLSPVPTTGGTPITRGEPGPPGKDAPWPEGGTEGQVITRTTDGFVWATPAGGGGGLPAGFRAEDDSLIYISPTPPAGDLPESRFIIGTGRYTGMEIVAPTPTKPTTDVTSIDLGGSGLYVNFSEYTNVEEGQGAVRQFYQTNRSIGFGTNISYADGTSSVRQLDMDLEEGFTVYINNNPRVFSWPTASGEFATVEKVNELLAANGGGGGTGGGTGGGSGLPSEYKVSADGIYYIADGEGTPRFYMGRDGFGVAKTSTSGPTQYGQATVKPTGLDAEQTIYESDGSSMYTKVAIDSDTLRMHRRRRDAQGVMFDDRQLTLSATGLSVTAPGMENFYQYPWESGRLITEEKVNQLLAASGGSITSDDVKALIASSTYDAQVAAAVKTGPLTKAVLGLNVVQSLTALNQQFGTWTIVDDGTSTANWPNRMIFQFDPLGAGETVQTFCLNEYGEPRVIPAKPNTVGFRVFEKQFSSSPAHSATVPVLEVMSDRDNRVSQFAVMPGGKTVQAGDATIGGKITASNLPPGILVLGSSDPVPGGTAAGTVIIRRAS